jgi:orotate phosphoribosyltransferase
MRQPEGFGLPTEVLLSQLTPEIQERYQYAIQFEVRSCSFEESRKVRAAVIAHFMAYIQPQWILGIAEGGIRPAAMVKEYWPNTNLIKTIKLETSMPQKNQLVDFWHPFVFPVYSHSEEKVRKIAIELPPKGESVMVIDNVYHDGFAANDVLGALKQKKVNVVAFAVERERYEGSLQKVTKDFNIPSFTAVNAD